MSGLPFDAALPPLARGGRLSALAALAVAAAVGAAVVGPGFLRLTLIASAATIALTVLFLALAARIAALMRRRRAAQVQRVVADDMAPCLTTDADGAILYRNRAAEARFDRSTEATLAGALRDVFAHPAAVLYRLQSRAARHGGAREDVVTRRGHLRLAVHRIGDGTFLWRLEELLERPGPGGSRGAEGLGLPMIVASRTGTVLFMNEAARRLVGGRPRTLDRIFTDTVFRPGEPVVICGLEGPVRALVAEVGGAGERRELYLLPAPPDGPRDVAVAEDDLPVALVRLGVGGTIRAANRRARDMLSLSAEVPAALTDLLDGPGRPLAHWLDDIAEGRLPARPEVMRLRRTAEDRFVQVVPWRAPDGALSAVLTDATALKTLEAQYAQGQKMQAIGQLAGGIAHDFNNLLTAISGHCDLLLISRDAADPEYADLMQIRQNANRAAALVSQLLAFSRKQPMLPERLELAEVLGDVTHLLRRLVGQKVTLDLAPSADPGIVRADRRQIEQVLINLVVNARDAMPDGGPIRIATARRTLFMPLLRGRATVPPGDYAVITVSDRGCGIPPDLQERIFEPFYTTKRAGEGTGLGLATVYGIVKQSGGFIFVDSQPGEGSTFTLWLPLHEVPPPVVAEPGDSAWVIPQIITQPQRRALPGDRAAASRAAGDGADGPPLAGAADARARNVDSVGAAGSVPAAPAAPAAQDADATRTIGASGSFADPSSSAELSPPCPPVSAGALIPSTAPPVLPDATPDTEAPVMSAGHAAPWPGETDGAIARGAAAETDAADEDENEDDGSGATARLGDATTPEVAAEPLLREAGASGRFDLRRSAPQAVSGPAAPLAETDRAALPAPPRDGVRLRDDAAVSGTDTPDMGRLDVGPPDMSVPDTGTADAGTPDMGTADAGTADTGTADMGMPDIGMPATGMPDVGMPDAVTPDDESVQRPMRAGAASAGSRGRTGVVLLVEDEMPVRTFASRALRLRGFTVIEAGCAEDALAALADPSLDVDVFVTDVTMPGMDGPTWVRRALEDRPGVRVVFVSGYAEESLPPGRAGIPESVFLAKPFSLDELTRTVQRQLH